MKLHHIGLNISTEEEVDHFYTSILKFWPNRKYEITNVMSREVFQRESEGKVFTVRNADLVLELFLTGEGHSTGFQHVCLEVNDREHVAEKAKAYGYPVIRLKREPNDMLFIKDKTGNIFELRVPGEEKQD
ncbi:MAG: VOC family protein [Bacteroidales bacterium]|nr:VOC family protein [Bacteroidales bacterium]